MPITRRHTIASAVALFFASAATSSSAESNPMGAPPAVEIYGRFPAVDQVALSPNGNRVAMVMRHEEDRVLVDFDLTTQNTLKKPLGPVKVRNILWADDERIAVIVSQTGSLEGFSGHSNELSTILVLDLAKNKSYSIFATDPDYYPMAAGGVGVITYNNRKMLTAVGIKKAGRVRLLSRFDPATGNSYPIDQGSEYTSSWWLDGNGSPVIRTEFREDTLKHSILINIGSGWKTAYSETEVLDSTAVAGIGRDGKSAVIYFQKGDRAHRYYNLAQDGTITGPIDKDRQGGESSALFDSNTRLHTGFAYKDYGADEWMYEYFSPDDQKRFDAVKSAMGDYRARTVDIADDKNKRIVYTEGFDDSGSYFFMNLATGKAIAIGRERPDLPAEWTAEKQSIRYKAADGLEIHGYLTLPPGRGSKNLPLIVLPHGGPQAHDDIGFDWMSQSFASRGYAVLQPNYRGSDGYGQAFVEKGYGEWGKKMQTDLSDGVRYLATQGIIDSKRVGIFGWSYGGYAAMAAATFDPEVYKCAAAGAGVSDLNAMMTWEGQESGTQRSGSVVYWKRYMGDDKNRLADVSPALHADKVTIPLLLLHGTDDTVVPIIQSKKMVDAMKAAGKPVEFIQLLREDHWMSTSEKNRTDVLKSVIAFMEKNNPPY